jgi:hypothetical protein
VKPAQLVIRILDPIPTKGLAGGESREAVRAVGRLRDEARDRIAVALGQGDSAKASG